MVAVRCGAVRGGRAFRFLQQSKKLSLSLEPFTHG